MPSAVERSPSVWASARIEATIAWVRALVARSAMKERLILLVDGQAVEVGQRRVVGTASAPRVRV